MRLHSFLSLAFVQSAFASFGFNTSHLPKGWIAEQNKKGVLFLKTEKLGYANLTIEPLPPVNDSPTTYRIKYDSSQGAVCIYSRGSHEHSSLPFTPVVKNTFDTTRNATMFVALKPDGNAERFNLARMTERYVKGEKEFAEYAKVQIMKVVVTLPIPSDATNSRPDKIKRIEDSNNEERPKEEPHLIKNEIEAKSNATGHGDSGGKKAPITKTRFPKEKSESKPNTTERNNDPEPNSKKPERRGPPKKVDVIKPVADPSSHSSSSKLMNKRKRSDSSNEAEEPPKKVRLVQNEIEINLEFPKAIAMPADIKPIEPVNARFTAFSYCNTPDIQERHTSTKAEISSNKYSFYRASVEIIGKSARLEIEMDSMVMISRVNEKLVYQKTPPKDVDLKDGDLLIIMVPRIANATEVATQEVYSRFLKGGNVISKFVIDDVFGSLHNYNYAWFVAKIKI